MNSSQLVLNCFHWPATIAILFQIVHAAEDEDNTLYNVLQNDPSFKTFLGAIDSTKLKDAFAESRSPPNPRNL